MHDTGQRRRREGIMTRLRTIEDPPRDIAEHAAIKAEQRRRNERIAAEEAAVDARFIWFGLVAGLAVVAGIVIARMAPAACTFIGVCNP
jgi:hypothetical protein